jgi:hypothetical protein
MSIATRVVWCHQHCPIRIGYIHLRILKGNLCHFITPPAHLKPTAQAYPYLLGTSGEEGGGGGCPTSQVLKSAVAFCWMAACISCTRADRKACSLISMGILLSACSLPIDI